MANEEAPRRNTDEPIIEDDDEAETEERTPATVTKVAHRAVRITGPGSAANQQTIDVEDGEADDEDNAEEDPDEWLFKQQAQVTAGYQKRVMQQAQQRVQKTLNFETNNKTLGAAVKNKTNSRTLKDNTNGSRSGGRGKSSRSQGRATTDEEDGYESSSNADGDDDCRCVLRLVIG